MSSEKAPQEEEKKGVEELEPLPEVPDLPVPPDGGYGWVIVAASFMINLVVDGVCYSYGVFFISLLEEFGESKAKTAWVGSLVPGCYLIIGPVTGALVNKFGCRPITIIGGFIAGTFFALSSFAPSINVLILTYGVMGGIGFGLMYLPGIVIVSHYFSTRRSMATGLAVCGSGIGTFIFGPLSTFLIETYGWRGALLLIAGFVLNGMIFGALLRPLSSNPPPKKKPPQTYEEVKRGIIMQKLIDQKKRERMISTRSLDGAVITNENKIVKGDDLTDIILEMQLPDLANGTAGQTGGSTPDLTDNGKPKELPTLEETLNSHESLSASQPHLSRDKLGNNNNKIHNKQLDRVKHGGSYTKLRNRSNSIQYDSYGSNVSLKTKEDARKREAARPMYRQDIFYTGSVQSLAEYKKSTNMTNYIQSVTSIPEAPPDENSCEAKCLPFKQILVQMFDFSMLKSPTFVVLAASGVLSFIGFFTPFIYTTEYALACGLPMKQATFLISVIGISNTVGRVAAGWLADMPWGDALWIHNISLVVAGLLTCIEPLLTTFPLLITFCVLFGTCIAAFIALRSIILVELLGMEKLNSAFGLLILFQGIAALIGTPISGAIVDLTGSHTVSFIVAGLLVAVSGVICFSLRPLSKWEKKRANQRQAKCITYREVPSPPDDISVESLEKTV